MLENVASSEEPDERIWRRWRQLVNMDAAELRSFMRSDLGKQAGLSRSEASRQGIKRGRQSAQWILKMLPGGRTYASAMRNWSPAMWQWARRQVSFISRMRGVSGPLYKDGEPTRKHLALLIWGHDPEKPLRKP